jgi:hypothetical protein
MRRGAAVAGFASFAGSQKGDGEMTKAMTGSAKGGALALAAVIVSSPTAVQAETPPLVVPWGSTSAVPSGPPGNRYCMIWAGKTQPMFNFTVREQTSHSLPLLVMSAPWLEGQPNLSPVAVAVTFPDGSTFAGRGVYGTEKNVTSTRMESLDAVLAGFSRPGVISVTIGDTTHRFRSPSLQQVIVAMRECVAALPAATRS